MTSPLHTPDTGLLPLACNGSALHVVRMQREEARGEGKQSRVRGRKEGHGDLNTKCSSGSCSKGEGPCNKRRTVCREGTEEERKLTTEKTGNCLRRGHSEYLSLPVQGKWKPRGSLLQ